MLRSRIERKLVAGVLLLFLVPTLLAGAVLWLLYRRGSLDDPRILALTVIVGFVAMMLYLAAMAHSIGRALAGTLHEIRHGTELMATVNPDYRLDVRTGDEMEDVAAEINRMADRVREAREGEAGAVARATRALELEQHALAIVLANLDGAVVAAALDGTITLANRAAGEALATDPLLGRNLFALTDEGTLRGFLVRLCADPGRTQRFTLRSLSGPVLEAGMTAFVDAAGALAGFILALREGSQAAGPEDSRRGRASPADDRGEVTPFPGAGLSSRATPGGESRPRPPLYDFSLLDQMARHLEPAARGAPLDGLTYVVIDIETTGLDARRDGIVSVAGVRVRTGSVRRAEAFDALVNPGRPVPRASTSLHGITDAVAAAAPSPAEVLPAFWRFIEGAVLVGHEIWFDLAFLGREATRLGLPPLPARHPVLDTHLLSRAIHREMSEHSLEAVAGRLGVQVEGRHSALGDALATAEVFARLIPLLARRGIITLGQAVDASRSARGPGQAGPSRTSP